MTDLFQSYLQNSVFPPTPLTTSESGTGASNLPMSNLASLLLSADQGSAEHTPQTGTGSQPASSGAGPLRPDIESGVITPEEISNITSSDAATVHSSASGFYI